MAATASRRTVAGRSRVFPTVRVQATTTKKVVVHGVCGVSIDGGDGRRPRSVAARAVLLGLSRRLRVFAYRALTDMRKSFNTLAALVLGMGQDVVAGNAFLGFVGNPRRQSELRTGVDRQSSGWRRHQPALDVARQIDDEVAAALERYGPNDALLLEMALIPTRLNLVSANKELGFDEIWVARAITGSASKGRFRRSVRCLPRSSTHASSRVTRLPGPIRIDESAGGRARLRRSKTHLLG